MDEKALFKMTYGLFLLTAKEGDKDNGCIINTAVQVANDPTRVSIAVIKKNYTCEMIDRTGIFTLSAISKDVKFELFTRFGMQSGREKDKFEGFDAVKRAENGLLYLDKWANAVLCAKVVEKLDLGSHMLFIGELTDAFTLSNEPSCTYADYHRDIKPKPKPVQKKAWVCRICGYVYEGDEVPDDFECPLCHHGKADFVPQQPEKEAKKYVCSVCGYVYEGENPPEKCPQCGVSAEKFTEQSADAMTWAAEHTVGAAKGVFEELLEGLRANFSGECTEVGMYLAMARVAHREGYPEIGKYWEKAAHEEAEHAAKFAELLGEVVTDSTRRNLEMRVEAENGATAGKTELAKLAKAEGLDAIHDTVHEMARDEARHGKALKGMLDRYFKK